MFWSNLFKKKDKENNKSNQNIANHSYSNIPSYKELTSEEQEYVSNLKKEYLNLYDTEDNYFNLDKELFNKTKMYQDLAFDIMLKDHFDDIVSSIIDSKKLMYYSHKLSEINNVLKYKYIALNVIRKDKKYLSKYMGLYFLGRRKINILKALDHQMNIINNMLVMSNQKITDYCACAIANYPKNIDENTKEALEKRYKEVVKDYKDLFNSSLDLNDNLTIADKITYMEIFIDKFIYENKDLIDKLKEQLDLIANSEIENMDVQINVIDNLKKIKMYYNIFNKYGRNKLTKEDFEDLYQIIFNAYTYFPINNDFEKYYNEEANDDEIKLYSKIIKSKAEEFILKQSKIFETNRINDKAYNILLNIFKLNENDETYKNMFIHDTFSIKDFSNVDLLLSLDFVDAIDEYFDKRADFDSFRFNYRDFFISPNVSKKDYYKYVLALCDRSNLEQEINESKKQVPKSLSELSIYNDQDEIKLYYILYKDRINFNVLPHLSNDCKLSKFLNYRRKSCKQNKDKSIDIYIPSKTKNLYLNLYAVEIDETNLIKVYANEQLEKILIEKDTLLYDPKIQIILPETSNFTSIVYDKFESYKLNDYDFLLSIRKFSKSIILPNKIFHMEDNNENNKWLFDYLFNLFYESILKLEHKVLGNYEDIFYELFHNLTILDKDNQLFSVGYNVEHSYQETREISTKISEVSDIIEAYKIYIEYFIKDLNSYKKSLKEEFIYNEKVKSLF